MARTRRVESERLRVPPPLIRRRVPSGRGAMEQPNVTHDGDAALTPRFWLAVALTGVATGLFGDLLMGVLCWPSGGPFTPRPVATNRPRSPPHRASTGCSPWRSPGSSAPPGWYLVRRYLRHRRSDIDDAIWRGDGEPRSASEFLHLGDLRGRRRPRRVDRPRGRAQVDGRRLRHGGVALAGTAAGPAPPAGGLRRWRGPGGGLQRPPRRGDLHRRGAGRQLRAAHGLARAGLLGDRDPDGVDHLAERADVRRRHRLPLQRLDDGLERARGPRDRRAVHLLRTDSSDGFPFTGSPGRRCCG